MSERRVPHSAGDNKSLSIVAAKVTHYRQITAHKQEKQIRRHGTPKLPIRLTYEKRKSVTTPNEGVTTDLTASSQCADLIAAYCHASSAGCSGSCYGTSPTHISACAVCREAL